MFDVWSAGQCSKDEATTREIPSSRAMMSVSMCKLGRSKAKVVRERLRSGAPARIMAAFDERSMSSVGLVYVVLRSFLYRLRNCAVGRSKLALEITAIVAVLIFRFWCFVLCYVQVRLTCALACLYFDIACDCARHGAHILYSNMT